MRASNTPAQRPPDDSHLGSQDSFKMLNMHLPCLALPRVLSPEPAFLFFAPRRPSNKTAPTEVFSISRELRARAHFLRDLRGAHFCLETALKHNGFLHRQIIVAVSRSKAFLLEQPAPQTYPFGAPKRNLGARSAHFLPRDGLPNTTQKGGLFFDSLHLDLYESFYLSFHAWLDLTAMTRLNQI